MKNLTTSLILSCCLFSSLSFGMGKKPSDSNTNQDARFNNGKPMKGWGEDLIAIRDLDVLWRCKITVKQNESSLNFEVQVKRDYGHHTEQLHWQYRVNATIDSSAFEKGYEEAKRAATPESFKVNIVYSNYKQLALTFDSKTEKLISVYDFYTFPSLASTECVRK